MQASASLHCTTVCGSWGGPLVAGCESCVAWASDSDSLRLDPATVSMFLAF